MNKVHPVPVTTTYANKTACEFEDSEDEIVEAGDGVVSNSAAKYLAQKVIADEDRVIFQSTHSNNPVFIDLHTAEEDQLYLQEAHVLSGRAQDEAAHLARVRHEEEELRRGFVDKNVRNEAWEEKRVEEEDRIRELTATQIHGTDINAGAREEQRLQELMSAHGGTEMFDVEEEERRLQEMVGREEQVTLVDEGDVTPEVYQRVAQERLQMVQTTLQNETERGERYQEILEGASSKQKTESQSHKVHRTNEDARLNDHIAKAETSRREESSQLLRQHTRKNLAAVENPAKKRTQMQTTRGILKFDIAATSNYSNSHSEHYLADDFDFIQQNKCHVQHKDFSYEKDTGIWQIYSDSEIVNITSSITDFKSFSDATGTNVHDANSDCDLINISHKHLIPTSASFGSAVNRHIASADSTYANQKSHSLHLDSSWHDRVLSHDIYKEGVRVQRVNRFNIPLPNTTEFSDHRDHFIPATHSYSHINLGLDIYDDCKRVQKGLAWGLCEVGELVQQKKGFSMSEGASQDRQDRNFYIPESGSQDVNNPGFLIPKSGVLLHNTCSVHIPGPGPGDVKNKTRHHHHAHKTFSPWKRNKFSIPAAGALAHTCNFARYGDASWSPCDDKYEINDLTIDEEYLHELEE